MNQETITEDLINLFTYEAALAPSPHNAQGWKFRFDGQRLDVMYNAQYRILHELDPDEKEGSIALGAAIENISLAALHRGFLAQIVWFPKERTPKERTDDDPVVASITFVPAAGRSLSGLQQQQDLYRYIEQRSMNRSKYKRTSVPHEQIEALQKIAAEEGLELCVITDRTQIKRLAVMAGEAGRFKFSHEPTHRELFSFLRYTAKEAAHHRDGLPLEHFNIPAWIARFGRIGMDWRAVRILNRLGYHRVLAFMQETNLVNSAPAVCLLRTKDGDRLSYLQGGRVLQRILLAAEKYQLAVQPHSAIADLGYARLAGYHESVSAQWRQKIDEFPARLRAIFSVEDDLHVINVFRIGYPTQSLEKRSLRRNRGDMMEEAVELDDNGMRAETYYQELTKRNYPFISSGDQQRLRKSRIGIAGCGSIGGAAIEVLVRMGAERLLLAEPDVFELSNLNRQNATGPDIGKHKAQSILERMQQINPYIKGEVLGDGVTQQNLHYFVGSSEVIIDGMDVTEKSVIQLKVMLHEEAWRQQKTVISGYDIAGTQLLRVYDYRSGKIRPLGGRFKQIDLEQLSSLAFLSRVISPLDLPIEMLPVTQSMIEGSQESIPQLGPTASLFGVLSAWAVLDLLSGRPVRHKISIDIPGALRPKGKSLILGYKRIVGIVKLKLLLNKVTKAQKRSRPQTSEERV
ncbi:hypothetical protein PAECIP111893_04085 [Paenibacillus plantiphilus]|uniref:THIF-type NAD/FAD binding fold domain-containing protein n=1 Tax=Paenibacillus plantiphilus TaxID=2905650 RepID=A0ABM9CM11_9BACL|nr:ThiF family adenylyltransferase [Paenibacillus plantiphilus]CAH1216261.1 hypothetical protein PAECIP111893_04085 [Paenibacillus plantiphilus]